MIEGGQRVIAPGADGAVAKGAAGLTMAAVIEAQKGLPAAALLPGCRLAAVMSDMKRQGKPNPAPAAR